MRFLTAAEISLRLLTPWSPAALAESAIHVNGRQVGPVITGEVLEAAVRWKDCCFLFITDNIPLEDSLRLYLFDAQWTLVDSATLGAMYATGKFSGLALLPPDRLRFEFIGGVTWTIELLDESTISLPFLDPTGVSRPFRLFKRFKIHGRPLPETGTR